jgi:hypothetical protein
LALASSCPTPDTLVLGTFWEGFCPEVPSQLC